MERRSTRLKENPVKLVTEELDMDHPAEVDEAFEDKPAVSENKPRGRKRKAVQDKAEGRLQTKRPRGKRGLLKQLVEMPLDVLFEIFGQLEPLDLLHLSRTTKDVRALLMSRSSISIWKQSRTNIVGMPECPDDLSEPQYAELAFGKRCYDCQRNLSNNHIIWSARVRYCTKCLDNHFVDKDYSWATSFNRQYPSDLARLIPTVIVSKNPGSRIIRSLVDFAYFSGQGRYMRNKHCASLDVDNFWRKEYQKQETAEGKENWLNNKVLEQKTINTHGELCATWFANLQNVRERQKASLVEERKAIVIERLKKMGWGHELERIPEIYDKPQDDPVIVKACQKELTERVLSNLEGHLDGLMEDLKTLRIAYERKNFLKRRLILLHQVYETYVSTLPGDAICPQTADIFRIPLVHDVINNLPSDVDLTEDHLDVIKESFPEIVEQWQKQAEETLIAVITKGCPEYIFDPEMVLHLATTFFSCSGGNYPTSISSSIRHTQAMTHDGSRQMHFTSSDNDPELLAVKDAINQVFWNWNNRISFKPETLKMMTNAVETCGFDPTTTTAQEMDEANPILECLVCNNLREGRATMTWSGVIAHHNEEHNSWQSSHREPMKLAILDGREATIVRARMAEELERRRSRVSSVEMGCNYCREKGNIVDLRKHIKQDHGKRKVMSEDIIPSIDQYCTSVLFRLWPPRSEDEEEPPADVPSAAEAAMDMN